MKPIDIKDNTYNISKEANDKDSKFKLVIMLEYQNAKSSLLKDTLQVGLKTFL